MKYNSSKDIVFGVKWFDKYQSRLLWLLNTPIIKIWFRWCLRIRRFDCPINTKINKITPNSFSYGVRKVKKGIQITTDFRTHDKYSKRLYFAFKPLWYILHIFDWVMLDRVEKLTKLSFGFSTLTVYPVAGANSPCDGVIYRGNFEDFATTRDNANGTSASVTDQNDAIAGWFYTSTPSTVQRLYRSFFNFDTSSLTASANISAGVMSIRGTDKYDQPTEISPIIDIYLSTANSTSTLVVGDYSELGSTSQTGSSITYANFSTVGYNAFTFDVTGRGNISKIGISKFGCREVTYDAGSTLPTWSSGTYHSFYAYYADEAGTTKDPKLVVTYTLPSAAFMTTNKGYW